MRSRKRIHLKSTHEPRPLSKGHEVFYCMATSHLQKMTGKSLRKTFHDYNVRENTRPSWLSSSKGERLELDFFIESISVAVEVQGQQHYRFTDLFHRDIRDFEEQQRRDVEKRGLCESRGIELFYIDKESDIGVVLFQIRAIIERKRSPLLDGFLWDKPLKTPKKAKSKPPVNIKALRLWVKRLKRMYRKSSHWTNTLGKERKVVKAMVDLGKTEEEILFLFDNMEDIIIPKMRHIPH